MSWCQLRSQDHSFLIIGGDVLLMCPVSGYPIHRVKWAVMDHIIKVIYHHSAQTGIPPRKESIPVNFYDVSSWNYSLLLLLFFCVFLNPFLPNPSMKFLFPVFFPKYQLSVPGSKKIRSSFVSVCSDQHIRNSYLSPLLQLPCVLVHYFSPYNSYLSAI